MNLRLAVINIFWPFQFADNTTPVKLKFTDVLPFGMTVCHYKVVWRSVLSMYSTVKFVDNTWHSTSHPKARYWLKITIFDPVTGLPIRILPQCFSMGKLALWVSRWWNKVPEYVYSLTHNTWTWQTDTVWQQRLHLHSHCN